MSFVETSLSATIISSLNNMISSIGPSPNEKLDILMDVISGMQRQNDGLADDFKQFRQINDNQTRLLEIIEMSGNNMPLTFIIVPGVDIPEKLSAEASYIDKMRNFSKRKTKNVTRILWEESRILFICPVTLNQVSA
jgi:hypothetical protein